MGDNFYPEAGSASRGCIFNVQNRFFEMGCNQSSIAPLFKQTFNVIFQTHK
jgi:hypothetical protein